MKGHHAALLLVALSTTALGQSHVAFTALIEEFKYDHAGKLVWSQRGGYAVRSDGSNVRVRMVPNPKDGRLTEQRIIVDLVLAERIAINEIDESFTVTPIARQDMEPSPRPPYCTTDQAPVRSSILGYDVLRNIELVGDQSERIFRKEEWRAPALNCFALKATLILGRPEQGTRVANLDDVVRVTIGEPPPALFWKPDGYRQRFPQQ